MQSKSKLFYLLPIIGAILTFLVCSSTLKFGYGLSDNGDFYRIMKVNKLQFVDEVNKAFSVKTSYSMELSGDNFFEKLMSTWETSDKEFYYSSHCIIISLSKSINYICNCLFGGCENYYNIKILGMIYVILFSFATFMILSFPDTIKVRVVILATLLIVFCDSGYILYFNSMYGEALQFVCVMIILGSYLQMIKLKKYSYFFICLMGSYFLAGSKLANIPFSILVVIGAGIIMRKRKSVWIFVIAEITFILFMFFNIPDWMSRDTNYQAVFFGILKNSMTVEADLRELMLPEEYATLQNTHAYMKDYPIDVKAEAFEKGFYDNINKIDILLFHIKHPVRFTKYMCKAIEHSSSMRPLYLGNTNTGRLEIINTYSTWSYIREKTKILYNSIFILSMLLIFIVIDVAFLFYLVKKKKFSDYFVALTVLIVGIISSLIIPIIGNGDADLAKHMFLFTQFVDIAFFSIIVFCVNKKKEKYFLLIFFAVFFSRLDFYGKTVNFGGYDWTVINETDSTMTLICNEIVCYREFDGKGEYGDNLWIESELRNWLNNELFSKEIQENIIPTSHFVCTSYGNSRYIEKGIHPAYWTSVGDYVADSNSDSYGMDVIDKVFIPDFEIYQDGMFKRDIGKSYWLCEPYASNESMVRYADAFGRVLHKDANEELGIRPVINVLKQKLY